MVHCGIIYAKAGDRQVRDMTSDVHSIRKLLRSERAKVREHFLRLDRDDRHLRFFGHVGDTFIEAYCEKILSTGYVVLGCFIEGELRAVGELRQSGRPWQPVAEIAITVEKPFQNQGIGTELLRRLIGLARNRAIKTLHLFCLLDNVRMQRVAKKLGGSLKYAEGEVEARIDPPWPTYWSLMEEAFADGRAVLHTWWLGDAA
jgi:RimJ/RimL family protein N-acetyltransferase